MKIGIITVYNSENCGSFLQAYSLFNVLKESGHVPYFLRNVDYISDSSHHLLGVCITICKCLVRLDFSSAKNLIQRHRLFSKDLKYADSHIVDLDGLNKLDGCVVGSDTLWNLYDAFFLRNIDDYTGKKLEIPFFYYAISGGNTTIDDVERHGIDFSPIENALGISCRDEGTCALVNSLIEKSPDIVLDPTLIVDNNIFSQFDTIEIRESVLIIYAFGRIGVELEKRIRKFAYERNVKVVSFGKKYGCSDVVVPNSPSYFISYFKKAKYIVTNTFHGCLFSVIFNKNFVIITDKKDKINNFLERIAISDRILCTPEKIETLDVNIDYDKINSWISLNKKRSLDYMSIMLNKIKL